MNKKQVKSKIIELRGRGSWGGVTSTAEVVHLNREDLVLAMEADEWKCPKCGKMLKKLKAVHNKADEFYCHPCRISIPCFIETMGPVDPNWPPRNKETVYHDK